MDGGASFLFLLWGAGALGVQLLTAALFLGGGRVVGLKVRYVGQGRSWGERMNGDDLG